MVKDKRYIMVKDNYKHDLAFVILIVIGAFVIACIGLYLSTFEPNPKIIPNENYYNSQQSIQDKNQTKPPAKPQS